MRRLASSLDQIKSHYSVVVVGSGYGGGIAASRFARAGRQVCVLERGREFIPGEYPDSEAEVARETQMDLPAAHIGSPTGLYDVRVNRDINVLIGCGLGGTSLINAGVALPPDPRLFEDPRWPAALRQDLKRGLEAGFKHASQMLQPQKYPANAPALGKIKALEKSAAAVGAPFSRIPINVTFSDRVNEAGVHQPECNGCGDCVTGCNVGAKNTTLMNYLPDAVNHGAEIFTEVSVRHIERGNGKWIVHFEPAAAGRDKFGSPTMFITADFVVLAAGTLGSTEILMRSRVKGLAVSDQIGKRFTGNGDVLGFSYNSNETINGVGFGVNSPEERKPAGPCITSILDGRNTLKLEHGFVIEEGSIPGGIGNLVRVPLAAAAGLIGKDTDLDVADAVKEKTAELETLVCGPYKGALQNTQTYLVMTHDDGQGQMVLQDDRIRLEWPGVGGQPIFEKVNQKLLDATKPLGGTFVQNPTWSKLMNQNLTTVHPLGGCVMAERAEDGVVNHKGQVFSGTAGDTVYSSLMVCDGAIVPRPLGINPLLTISALAERAVALIARDQGWTIDYTNAPPAPVSAVSARPVGVRFTETMKGQLEGEPFQFILTITAEDADKMLTDEAHHARAVGIVTAPKLSDKPLTVREGDFQLFVKDPARVETHNMIYRLKMESEEGKTYFMHGVKLVHDDGRLDTWDDTTTLFITVYAGESEAGPVLGKGVLRIQPQDFAIQMQTMEVLNATNRQQQMEMMARVGMFFAGTLFETYGGVADRKNRIDATKPVVRKKRALRMNAPELHWVKTSDGTMIRLTRYAGGVKGPVVLSPGFGVSTLSFSTDTVDTNLPEFLYAHGYDVWLLDYRASPDLPSSSTQFTLDDIALRDYPAAIARVREASGADSVQMIAHCIGSMTLLMGLMGGLEGVRSVICSQLGLFPITSTLNEVKAGLKVGHFLIALGENTVNTNLPPADWRNKLAEAVLQMFPRQELCKSSVCHQVRLIYGDSYKHEQLNAATHDTLHEMFGIANISAFNHILKAIQADNVVDKDGKDVYMPNVARLKLPIAFVQGVDNQLFLPEGTKKTFRYLCDKNGSDYYTHIQFPRYAHMDLFVGKNAATEVYPTILLQLDANAQ